MRFSTFAVLACFSVESMAFSAESASPVASSNVLTGPVKPAQTPDKAHVTIEQSGKPIATGVILDADGRILSAIRITGKEAIPSREVAIVYSDRTRVPGKILHADEAWGLALVVPLEGKRQEGLRASELESSALSVWELSRPKNVELLPARAIREGLIPQGLLVSRAGDLKVRPGTPVLDSQMGLFALSIRVCAKDDPKLPCQPGFAPLSAIRSFLSSAPKEAQLPTAWLGIRGQAADGQVRGVVVLAVAKESSAESAKLRADSNGTAADVIVAVDGKDVGSPEELAASIGAHGVGETIVLKVFDRKVFREVRVKLRSAPPR